MILVDKDAMIERFIAEGNFGGSGPDGYYTKEDIIEFIKREPQVKASVLREIDFYNDYPDDDDIDWSDDD